MPPSPPTHTHTLSMVPTRLADEIISSRTKGKERVVPGGAPGGFCDS